jgi:hypothetical protein
MNNSPVDPHTRKCSLCEGLHYGHNDCPYECSLCRVKYGECTTPNCPRNERWAKEKEEADQKRALLPTKPVDWERRCKAAESQVRHLRDELDRLGDELRAALSTESAVPQIKPMSFEGDYLAAMPAESAPPPADMVRVPREPTEAMLWAAFELSGWFTEPVGPRWGEHNFLLSEGITQAEADAENAKQFEGYAKGLAKEYRAMLSAAAQESKG